MRTSKWLSLFVGLTLAGWLLPVGAYSAESKDSVSLVPAAERSRHFAAVSGHLELGGTLFGYADVDGDTQVIASGIRTLADQIATVQPMAGAFLKQDYAKILDDLGVSDVKALGLSSVQDLKGGYRNRVFFYTPNGRHGLLAGLGGPAAPFVFAKMAPGDSDLFAEAEVDVPVVYAALKAVVTRVAGEATANIMDAQLKTAGAPAGISALEIIQSLKGRGAMILRFQKDKTWTVPDREPLVIPAFQLLIRMDGLGASLEKALVSLPVLKPGVVNGQKRYVFQGKLPFEGLQPVLAVEGGALYFATSEAFLDECLGTKSGLESDPGFKQALAQVEPEGNGLLYVNPRFFEHLRAIPALNPNAPVQMKGSLAILAAQIPAVNMPLIAERCNLPDGILVRSHWYRSMKQDLALLTVYNPVTIGMMAAMAVPAFQKVRSTSQEKAITNNLRQFSSAAHQYMLENVKTSVAYADIVGPGKLIPMLRSVAGEDYSGLVINETDTSISVQTADGRTVTYRW